MTDRARWLAAMAGVSAIGLVGPIATGDGVVDDAWISWRYAEHAALGHGFVYNAGEPPVEGFTNLAWTGLLAAAAAARVTPAVAFAGLGCVGAALAPAGVVALARILGSTVLPAAIAGFALAVSPHFAVVAGNGIESAMWVAAVLWSGVAILGTGTAPAAVAMALLVAVRPEGAAVALIWLLGRVHPDRGRLGVAWLAGISAISVWRLATYGRWLPNTWEAKLARPLGEQIQFNLSFLTPDREVWIASAVALLLVPLGFGRDRRRWATWMVALVLGALAFRVDLWMPGGRLLQPVCALTLALLAPSRAGYLSLGWALILPFTPPGQHPVSYDGRHTVRPGSPPHAVGHWLADHAPPGAWLATRDAGLLAAAVGPAVRVAELHERALTQPHPGARDADWRTYTPPDPEFVVPTVQRADAPASRYASDRALLLSLRRPYRYLGRVEQHYHRYYDVYVRADLAIPDLPSEWVVNRRGPEPAPGDRPFPTLPSDRPPR